MDKPIGTTKKEADTKIAQTKQQLGSEVEKALEVLYRVRDEVRVRVHLAGAEAEKALRSLEPKIEEAEALAKRTEQSGLELVRSVTQKLESLVASIGKPS